MCIFFLTQKQYVMFSFYPLLCFVYLMAYVWYHSLSIQITLPYFFCGFLVLCSVDSLLNQFSLDGHLVLFLSFAITNNATVDNTAYISFCLFFSWTLSWLPRRRIIESSGISMYNYTKYLPILLGESLGIVLFCVPSIKHEQDFSHTVSKADMLSLNRNLVTWWVRNSVKFFLWHFFFPFLMILCIFFT